MLTQTIRSKIDAQDIGRSVFRDRNGWWAKEWADVVTVYVEFEDASIVTLEPAEFKALTRAQQDKIRQAPSSPMP